MASVIYWALVRWEPGPTFAFEKMNHWLILQRRIAIDPPNAMIVQRLSGATENLPTETDAPKSGEDTQMEDRSLVQTILGAALVNHG